MTLQEYFEKNPRFALAFSGGIDSAYLLWEAKEANVDVTAYMVKTPFQADFEKEDGRKLCDLIGAKLKIMEIDNMEERILKNDRLRCYYCKSFIMSEIIKEAKKDGYETLVDGTNFSDSEEDRPGVRALSELKVESPLKLAGLTKREIRQNAKAKGIFLWNKPSYSCLATRIETDNKIDRETLAKIQRGEMLLFGVGLKDFRLRTSEGKVKLQVREEYFLKVIENREYIYKALSQDFSQVTLDLKERKGENYE